MALCILLKVGLVPFLPLVPFSFLTLISMIRYFLGTDYDYYSNVRSNYVDNQQNQSVGSAPSPPYALPPPEPSYREAEQYHSHDGSYHSQDTPRELPQRPQPPPQPQQQPQQQPPSPARKSMFDFISPFDALASSASSQTKKKPVPQTQPTDIPSSSEDTWTSASLTPDPKRKSVENLMDQLTRGQGPSQAQISSPSYDAYLAGDDFAQEPRTAPPPPPLPPKPTRAASPRAPSPKVQAQVQHRPQPRNTESPVGQPQLSVSNQRAKESSPRGSWKTESKGKGPGPKAKAAKYVYICLLHLLCTEFSTAHIPRLLYMMYLCRWTRFRRLGRPSNLQPSRL